MLIKDLFRDSVERYINPVIKVQEDDIGVAKQELQEYVITDQLRGHFEKCLDKYLNDKNKVGYWVSGWFGSGKSHFLKIFGYLLENHQFDDCSAADVFLRRDETNILKPYVDKINSNYKTTVVMFDILEEAAKLEGKVEPIELTIYKQLLSKRGFYTGKLWVAEMEKELFDEGKYEEFVQIVESMSNKKWEDIRKTRIGQNYIQRALVKVLPEQIPTESIAKDYIEDLKSSKSISASMLADELYKYVEKLDKQNGKNNRLFVIVDEIGQYISANPDVIGYLQAIESTFARKGKGKLWFAVSSQNRLEQITEQYLKTEDEINKVIDRFEVRIHLTPENLDEVINERVLKKKTEVVEKIDKLYEGNKGKLLSVLEFKDFKKHMRKPTKEDFINTYPFMPYHIELIQPIYYNVISRSKVNKKFGGTNRSMIKATQGILVDGDINVKEREVGELVTLDMFFEQAKEFIDDQMQVSIKEAAQLDASRGEFLVKILKVLYLLDNEDKLQKNIETIAKLLVNNVNSDFMEVLENVKSGLDILYKHGYVEKDAQGNYKFIAPEEQSFRQEAISRSTEIGVRDINKKVKEVIDSIFTITRLNYKNIRPFDVQLTIDDEVRTNKGLVTLNLNSTMQCSDELRRKQHFMKSIGDSRNIYWYAKYDSTIDEDMQQYLIFGKIIEEYRRKWGSDEDKSYFLRKEEQKNIKLFEDIKEKIARSFKGGTYIYQGKEFPVPDKNDIKSVFESIANVAIPHVYHRFDMVGVKVTKEDIQTAFKENQLSIDLSGLNLIQDTNVNAESAVLKEVLNEVKTLRNKYGQCIGKDLLSLFDDEPYGWASEAVRLFTALLFKNGNIELNYEGKDFLDYNQAGVRDIFENEPNFRKAVFKPAVVVDAATRQKCQDILKEMFGVNSDDTLVELYKYTRDTLVDYRNSISAIKQIIISDGLPFGESINKLDEIFNVILKSKTQGDTINNFVQKSTEYEALLNKYKKLDSFTSKDKNNNLPEYRKMKSFLEDLWIIDLDNNSEDVNEKKKAYDEIMTDIKSESFVDSWPNIRENYYKLYDPYVKEYMETHETLHKLYSEKIQEMKNNKSYLNLKSDIAKGDILSTLSNKLCTHSVGKIDIPCPRCRAYIRDMKTVIDAVEIYNEKAIEKLYKYLNKQLEEERNNAPVGGTVTVTPKPVIKNLKANDFPKGIMIQSHKDVKQYLKRIEKQLMDEINAGNSIMIE
ncbi:MAG: BREX system P-loop protein BrxC [Clostridium butyricum]|nr:BREX system P-loop protein BrxC [Clostridium butyricum]